MTAGYSCSPDLTNGVQGCTTKNPLFMDRASFNFHLKPNSPCVNAGLLESWMTGAFDFDGNARVLDKRPDMGAYECTQPNGGVMVVW